MGIEKDFGETTSTGSAAVASGSAKKSPLVGKRKREDSLDTPEKGQGQSGEASSSGKAAAEGSEAQDARELHAAKRRKTDKKKDAGWRI